MKIMIPLDGSTLAEGALAPAADLARRYDGELLLVTVLETSPGDDAAHLQAESYLGYHKRSLGDQVPCQTKLLSGATPELLLQCAQESRADLIVMASHGRSGGGRWKIGRVTDKVMRQAPCSVLIVRGRACHFKKVVAPLDGSPEAETALPVASRLSRWGQLTLVRVVDTEPPLFGADATHVTVTSCTQDIADYLSKLGEDHEGTVIRRQYQGSPAEHILECADHDADLIVLNSHSRGWPKSPFFGSVAERVIHHAPCSVLLLRGERPLTFTASNLEAAVSGAG